MAAPRPRLATVVITLGRDGAIFKYLLLFGRLAERDDYGTLNSLATVGITLRVMSGQRL